MYRVGIITASDKGSRGERIDESGQKIKDIVSQFGYEVSYYKVLPDDKETLSNEMKKLCDEIRISTAYLSDTENGNMFPSKEKLDEFIKAFNLKDDEEDRFYDENLVDIILTTGGTGFSKRDNTPEATLEIAEKLVPGISEAVRNYSMQFTKKAMLSRAVSVIRKETLIINMPGSPKAVKESMECIMPALNHGLDILKGTASECARK